MESEEVNPQLALCASTLETGEILIVSELFLLTESTNYQLFLIFVDSPKLESEEVNSQQVLNASTLETGDLLILL